MLFLGFSSGLPLLLTSGTLQAWMAVEEVDIETIGLFSLVGLPYAWKFLWAPVFDAVRLPFLGRRRGWMVLLQLVLLAGVGVLGFVSPKEAPLFVAALAFTVAFASASQDVVLDAYRTDVLRPDERGPGISLWVLGYRAAMITAGALALVLGEHWGWKASYLLMGSLMAVGILASLAAPRAPETGSPPRTIRDALWTPLRAFLERRKAAWLLALILLYKLCDSYAASLGTAFLVEPKGLAFTPTDVAVVNKGLGVGATMAGVVLGGVLLVRTGLYRGLLVFGVLQALTNVAFMALAERGHDYPFMVAAIVLEKFAGGMGDVPFLALLMALCDRRFSAFQYALLSSVPALGRSLVSATAGYVVSGVGWTWFFGITVLAAVPGLVLLARLRPDIDAIEAEGDGGVAESMSSPDA